MEPTGDHLASLANGWSVWRLAALRSAGMPFDWLERLAGDRTPAEQVAHLLGEERFLRALTWQNPTAVANWVGRFAMAVAAGELPRLSAKRAAMLARYAQRYCAKNDTIGSFGPVAWARLSSAPGGVRQVGTAAIRRASVHFETWAITALVERWRQDKRIWPHVPVRLHPAAYYDGVELRRPWREREHLPELTAAVLAALDRPVTCAGVAQVVRAGLGCADEDVLAEIESLERDRFVIVGFDVPFDDRPEQGVREQLNLLPPNERELLLDDLDQLEQAAKVVAGADADADRLARALADLDSVFTALTARPATRTKEEAAAGRLTVYTDSRRDLDVTVGDDALETLRGPLGLLLDSARWLTAEIADSVEHHLVEQYARLRARRAQVYLGDLYLAAADVLSGAPGTQVHHAVDDFQQRWAEVLRTGGTPDGDGGIRFALADIAPVASALFPARAPRWNGARCHSPDVMLSMSGGRVKWVLGELHLALNTLESRVFHTQADQPDYLAAGVADDMAAGRVVALLPSDSPEVSPRTYPPLTVHVPGRYAYWSLGKDAGAPAGARSTPAAGLPVRKSATGLEVGPVDGSWSASVIEALGELLTALVVNRFQLRAPARHQPRISVDDVVICRETWRYHSTELPWRPVDLVRALRADGVCRRVFVRVGSGTKPFYVDLDAPLLVRNFGRLGRHAPDSVVEVTEMLPTSEELWVRDEEQHSYTSELRMVAVADIAAPGPVFAGKV